MMFMLCSSFPSFFARQNGSFLGFTLASFIFTAILSLALLHFL